MHGVVTNLVQTLPDGPLDIVADVHGEIEALRQLLARLGYAADGSHPADRRLVFLGDLTDRGPDSPAVVRLVRSLVEANRASCLLGNHELNLLQEKRKHGNHWFFGQPEAMDDSGVVVRQVLANDEIRHEVRQFFLRLPLALERDDLCLVHACWHAPMIEHVRQTAGVLELYDQHSARVQRELNERGVVDPTERTLARQNRNPIKVLTSGFEARAEQPFFASGRWRDEKRVAWWNDYTEPRTCVFGHYSRRLAPLANDADNVFGEASPLGWLGSGQAMCIDYAVARRWQARLARRQPDFSSTPLAAFRFPERELVFDSGQTHRLPEN